VATERVIELRARILEEVQLQHKHSAVVTEISDILHHEFKDQAKPNIASQGLGLTLVDINNHLY
jgi:hypothetical protein